MGHINIRRAVSSDSKYIIQFNRSMALETENLILQDDIITPGVSSVFENHEYGFYLIAEYDNEIAGCLMITYEWSDWRNRLLWWIQSVYVVEKFRRMGIFTEMYNFVKNEAKQHNAGGLRLYVEKENEKAKNTYLGMGMSETHYRLFEDIF